VIRSKDTKVIIIVDFSSQNNNCRHHHSITELLLSELSFNCVALRLFFQFIVAMRLTMQPLSSVAIIVVVFVVVCVNAAASMQQVTTATSDFLGRIKGKSLFETVKLWTHEHPVEARTVLEGFTTKFVKDEKERQDFIETIDDLLVEPLADDNGGCGLCRLLFQLLKIGLARSNYTVVEENLIYYCEFLIVAIDQRIQAKELCGGLIPLQAPSICEVATTIPIPTEQEFCEFINACFPPPAAVSSRTRSSPWKQVHPHHPQQQHRRSKNSVLRGQKQKPPSSLASIEGVIKIAQLTDIHLEKDYATDSTTDCWLPVCCKSKYGPGDSRHYASYQCNIPQRTMELFFDGVNQLDPDIIFFTGDIPPHTMWDESLDSQLNCTVALTETLARTIKTTPIYPCIGNHEMFPTNLLSLKQMPDRSPYLLNQFANLWAPLANFTDEEIQTMNTTGHYTKLLNYDRLRLVAMNTLYMYTANFYNVLNHNDRHTEEASQLKDAIVSILLQARNDNEKVIFLGHHVPGNSDFIISQSRWYQELMVRFSDIIILHLSGHTHTDEFRLFKDADGSVTSMVYVSPSVDSHDFRNPSMRLFYVNQTTYEIIDYDQYYLDVSVLPPGGDVTPPTIVKLYSAKEEYGLPDLSPQSWLDLLDRFRTDPELLQKHLLHSHANAVRDASAAANCSGKCVEDHICRMSHSSYDDYYYCINPVVETSPPSTITWPIITEASTPPIGHVGDTSAAPPSAILLHQSQHPLQLLLLTITTLGIICLQPLLFSCSQP
jgi:sphingomyelin phosphodiesterase